MNSAESLHVIAPPAVQSHQYPNPLRAWWTVGVFCFAALISYTDRLILSALVDPIKRSFRVDDSAISLLQGVAFAVFCVFSGLLLGRLADQKRRLTILLVGSAVWCAGTVACGLAPSYWVLFAARAAVGVGEAALAPAAVSIIADSFSPIGRGTALGIFFLGFTVGAPASIATGSVMLSLANAGKFSHFPVIGALEPWRAVLVIVGMGGFAVAALFLTLQEPARHGGASAPPLRVMVNRLAVERHSLAPAYLAMGMLSIGDYAILAWMPSVLSRRFGMSLAELGEAFGIVTVAAGVLACLIGGVGSDAAARRYGTRGRLRFSLAAAVIASIGAALISCAYISGAFVGLGLWTLCSATSAVSGIAAIQNVVPAEYRGMGIALVAFCNMLLGLGLGPTLVAVITEHVYRNPASVGLAITTTSVPVGVVAVMLFLYASRSTPLRGQPAQTPASIP